MAEEDERLHLSDLLAEVNLHVHEFAEGVERRLADAEDWSFRCECGDPGCREAVSLTLADYEEVKRTGGAVLARGHRPTPPQQTRTGLDERELAAYSRSVLAVLARSAAPLSLREIASQLSIERAGLATALYEMLRRRLIRPARPHP
jgi:hypothetical protein